MHARVSVDPAPAGSLPVVLVHGIGVAGRFMVPVAELLSPHHRVHVPDLPGFGESGKPDHVLDVLELTDALVRWTRAIGLERAAFLGNSFGCQIVADLALRYPDLIERAVLQGPTMDPQARSARRQLLRWLDNSRHESPSQALISAREYRRCGVRQHGYRLRRVVFEESEHPSPLVADLYRWWYEERGLPTNRLLIESFSLLEPWWALRTGSVPFWTKFNMEPDLEWIENYLGKTEPYEEIRAMLFSHGVESVGLPSIERWRTVLRRARKHGSFIGVAEEKFPKDYANFVRYHTDLKKIPSRFPMPGSLPLSRLDNFLGRFGDRYPVRWL